MIALDWLVLCGTLLFIVGYGTWKTRQQRDLESYLRGGRDSKWFTIGLSVMATQASAITFLSVPGQAFESGMGFLQFYFGLPLALIIVCAFFIPIFYKLNVFTAYEYLEQRFDLKTRLLTAALFLIQRGLAAGITIYAPAIVLSSVLGWNLNLTNVVIGVLVIIYTVSGGTKAVSLTQKWQMGVIMAGMFFAFYTVLDLLAPHVSFLEAIAAAGEHGKMEIINLDIDIEKRYTLWSGLTGGLFLALSYFGTDQSQVQRYISGSSVQQSRMGLMFNAVLKIPMQFFILLTGVLLFVFYMYNQKPINFNDNVVNSVMESDRAEEGREILANYESVGAEERSFLANGGSPGDKRAQEFEAEQLALAESFNALAVEIDPAAETKDSDYVFISFILNYLPHGAIGLLLAMILSAAMSSTAGELNALATTSMNDFYKRLLGREAKPKEEVIASKLLTVLWGVLAICFALAAQLVDNLIELVNILGSIFYGTILGIFLCAFFLRHLRSNAVFYAALVAEVTVIIMYFTVDISFLLFNIVGCVLVILLAHVLMFMDFKNSGKYPD